MPKAFLWLLCSNQPQGNDFPDFVLLFNATPRSPFTAPSESMGQLPMPGSHPPHTARLAVGGPCEEVEHGAEAENGAARGRWAGPSTEPGGIPLPLKACAVSNQSDNMAQGAS